MPPPDRADELRAHLQSSLGLAYTLERELGGGGMSRVFVADEPALGRKVVVKVLSPDLAAGFNLERFEREIMLIASLQQANIVPLLSAGRTELLSYYTMPLVEGRSLRERLAREGPLPIRDGVNILRDVARALAYAHERGVVHRDIKPDNVLLSGDTAIVTDFGIAKALSVAGANPERLTLTGTGIGTPAYMSPEQAVGDPSTDHRADLYAFGCLAYEVFTGSPPFHDLPAHQVVAAHFQQTPQPVTRLRPEVPAALAALVARCLAKDPAQRPQTARELLQVLDSYVEAPRVPRRRVSVAAALGATVVALALAAGAASLMRRLGTPARDSPHSATLAVLPFLNLGGDSAQEYLADGIRDEVATAMGKVPGVRIIGRSAAFHYRGRRDLDVRDVGRSLGARYLLQGSLRQTHGHLSVSAQLSDSAGGAELWSDQFVRDTTELSSVRDDIVRAISDTLRLRAGVALGVPRGAPKSEMTNPQAYDLYLRGENLLQRRGSGVAQSVVNFEGAIAADNRFARAYSGLSAALVLLPYFNGRPPAEYFDRATAAARRALALDSTLSEAHTSLAIAYWNASLNREAENEYRRALALSPDDAGAHFQYGRFLVMRARVSEGLPELARAKALDQVSAIFSTWYAYALFLNGALDSALAESERARQIDSTILPVVNIAALIHLAAGRKPAARRLAVALPVDGAMSNAAYVLAATGDTAAAMRLLRAMESQSPRPWFSEAARGMVMLAVNDTGRALAAFEKAADRVGGFWTQYLPIGDPAYDAVRQSPHFLSLIRRSDLDVRLVARSVRWRSR